MKVEPSYIIHGIGPKLRELRKAKGIRLSELAEESGLSVPMISKIENGRVVPTIPSLFSLLETLEMEPEVFFGEINSEPEFSDYLHIRDRDYKKYVKEESAVGFLYRSILEKSMEGQSFQVSHVALQPGNDRPKVMTDAFEFLYILEGNIDYYLEDQLLKLQKGDSLFFDGRIPHVPLNRSDRQATYIVIYFFNKKD